VNKPNEILHPFENLSLWKHFIASSSDNVDLIQLVKKHIEITIPLLEQYINTFPKYTLHNLRHQQNVIRLMGLILGTEVKKLSSLESAILILSAVYHDIGMVFKQEEIENVAKEHEFKIFLKENIKAKLLYEENNQIVTVSLIEWYCRWIHAKRVWHYLNLFDKKDPIIYGSMPFKDELGQVCESHNESIEYLKNDDKFNSDFLGEKCDLKFCAILLRLADILDFDNTRSPKSVFEFLELDKPKNQSDVVSLDEWNKHLSSNGFKFNKSKDNVQLLIIAAPPHPKVEVGIRNFIKVINEELIGCSKLLKFCSPRWNNFKLPNEVDTSGIKSKDYKSGNFRFSLSEDKILDLLTGEGLYDDQFVFIRELLQNAIDTSRHREFLEHFSNIKFKANPINVSFFIDNDGYQWIRIDDYGRGMNEEIIINHLLKKGESYYNSNLFKLEKLSIKEKTEIDFVPISRFGIGLLSCFIVADKIEINTKFYDPNNISNIESFRISVEGRSGFFVLQSKKEKHEPSEMPSPLGAECAYRDQPGTSIAVRLNQKNEFVGLDIKEKIEEYVLCSPIPIKFEGQIIGGDFNELLQKPWAKEISLPIDSEFVKKIEELFEVSLPSGIDIDILPINISENSLDENLKGQIVFVALNVKDIKKTSLDTEKKSFRIEEKDNKIYFKCIKRFRINNVDSENVIEHEIKDLHKYTSIPTVSRKRPLFPELQHQYEFDGLFLSHNGVIIHDTSRMFVMDNRHFNSYHSFHNGGERTFLYAGILYFQDKLLPKLTVSRNKIQSLDFNIVANLLYSTKVLNKYNYDSIENYEYFDRLVNGTFFTTKIIKESNFYESNRTFWDNEKIVISNNGEVSLNELKELIISKPEIILPEYNSYFLRSLVGYILVNNFEVALKINKENKSSYITILHLENKRHADDNIILDFYPLRFVDFMGLETIIKFHGFINKSHRLIQWYLQNYVILKSQYNSYKHQLIYSILDFQLTNQSKIENINKILARLRVLLPSEAKPSEELNLTKKDFECDFEDF